MATLGIRNNNPLNIRNNPLNKWKHQKGSNKGFCVFDSTLYGVRAGLCLLRTYCYHYGLNSVREIISRFAPPSENATQSYVYAVCRDLKINPDDDLYLDFYSQSLLGQLYLLAKSICKIESNYELTDEEFTRAIQIL